MFSTLLCGWGQTDLDGSSRFWETPALQAPFVRANWTMLSILSALIKSRSGRWCWIAAAIACLGLSGCARFDLRGESFKEDEASETLRQLRPRDAKAEPWGACNKALQVEKDLGY